ncbi:MAG: 1-deoxy-D-xylulose-5-phosphate reductoisomerase [Candidatus Omnitrophota bacterium]|jgi:1-deoxy-D-xylulose-5-phosphate reductoisomerase
MKKIAVLGSTGSIGESTLSVIRQLKGQFKVEALSVNSDINGLKEQIEEFSPRIVCVRDKGASLKLKPFLGRGIKLLAGEEGLGELVRDKEIQRIMLAISGSAALVPLVNALKCGKEIALANKEALVMAGPLVMGLARKHKAKILPVDSEQSAIWQSLGTEDKRKIRQVYLTASGGPLNHLRPDSFKAITLKQVLRHPRWKMGKKITVDSATLMNKGLELLEAMFLFNLPFGLIKVLIHPEALIHSMVEFEDGVIIAQLSATDMRIPIQYALTYPDRAKNIFPRVDFYKLGSMHFAKPDLDNFPCLKLAYQAAKELGSMPAVLNGANEASVNCFLNKRIGFMDIPKIVERVMRKHKKITQPSLTNILEADAWAKEEAMRFCRKVN